MKKINFLFSLCILRAWQGLPQVCQVCRKYHGEFSPSWGQFHLWCHGPHVSRLEEPRDPSWNARKQWFHGRWSASGYALYRGAFVWNCWLSFARYRKEYSAIFLELWRYRKRANCFAGRFSKSLSQWGNRDFSWLCDRYSATQPCWSHRCRSLHDRPSIC